MRQVLAGRYEIERELGQGGFGQTYLASDRLLPGHPLCVVKQLNPQVTNPKNLQVAKRLFETEAQTLQRLGEGSKIPRLLAFFEQEDEFYLVQEYIQGHELTDEIQEGYPWPEPQIIQLLHDILTPLEWVHQQGVIHRDIKPTNLIRRASDRQLVLIDFGAVKQTLSNVTTLTPLSVVIGSHSYMPSEQAIGRPKLSSDIYAVGMIVIQALTGKLPTDIPKDPDTEELLWQQFAAVSPELERILAKMVPYHFGDRYPSAVEALEAVNTLSIFPSSALPPVTFTNQTIAPDAPTWVSSDRETVTIQEDLTHQDLATESWREDLGDGVFLDLICIPGGTFLMGEPEAKPGRDSKHGPQRLVKVSMFSIGQFQVTQAQWRKVASWPQVNRFLESDPSYFKGENLPVTMISWYDCEEFCDRLSRYTGQTYRLPAEAEWEYACRAGTTTPFSCGETLTSDLANYHSNETDTENPAQSYREQTTPVGSFPPNPFGLYDMHGNVWEWCGDRPHPSDRTEPTNGRTWSSRALRGGSWDNTAEGCRSWTRYWDAADNRSDNYGFRVLCVV